ncbi:hypothetical protein [Cupriavidus sp. amp6]|uniref:hypothetical protein n=1 Tax=Cupriavidus sp. amp6 TaxID=388051 RepID=UPI00048BBD59|nr:hypothetical protein [Cupriavidus sp. amp6]
MSGVSKGSGTAGGSTITDAGNASDEIEKLTKTTQETAILTAKQSAKISITNAVASFMKALGDSVKQAAPH